MKTERIIGTYEEIVPEFARHDFHIGTRNRGIGISVRVRYDPMKMCFNVKLDIDAYRPARE